MAEIKIQRKHRAALWPLLLILLIPLVWYYLHTRPSDDTAPPRAAATAPAPAPASAPSAPPSVPAKSGSRP